MVRLRIGENDENQRLDRFLRKYYKNAGLAHIYKLIRKDIKVNGKRAKEQTILKEGDELCIYISEEESERLSRRQKRFVAKKQFKVVYEDDDLIIVDKPFGLLTHGNSKEKKNTLVNQVIDYLIEKGDFDPKNEKTFRPASIGRLDRNTTGLVMFGKTARGLRDYSRFMRTGDAIGKFYETIVAGELKEKLMLEAVMTKDEERNIVDVMKNTRTVCIDGRPGGEEAVPSESLSEERANPDEEIPVGGALAKRIETIAEPIKTGKGFTHVRVELKTGRTHQIRAHLASEGFSVIGDAKYGDPKVNKYIKDRFGLSSQLLHCAELRFNDGDMKGKSVKAKRPKRFKSILKGLELE